MGRRTRLGSRAAATTVVLLTAAAIAPPSTAQTPPAIKWVHHDGDNFVTAAGLVDANEDRTPDVVLAAADRLFYWVWVLPPGHPMALVNQTRDKVTSPNRKLIVLDGRTGTILWEKTWAPARIESPQDGFEVVEDLDTGDFDGDGEEEIVVSRTSYDASGKRPSVHRLTSYDADSPGRVNWQKKQVLDRSVVAYAADFQPLALRGRRVALIAEQTLRNDDRVRTRFTIVHLDSDRPPRRLTTLPAVAGTASWIAEAAGDRLLVFRTKSVTRRGGDGVEMVPAGLDAFEVRATAGAMAASRTWSASTPASAPLVFLDGARPLLVARGRDEFVARDARTGAIAWTAPSSEFGATATAVRLGVTSDEDLAWSPTIGPDVVPAPAHQFVSGGSATRLAALGHATGEEIWAHRETLGKFGALRLEPGQLMPGAGEELLAIMAHQDGFSHTTTPYDDHGLVTIQDAASADILCRFSTGRVPTAALPANLDAADGPPEIVVPTYGGTTYAFRIAEPWCGALARLP